MQVAEDSSLRNRNDNFYKSDCELPNGETLLRALRKQLNPKIPILLTYSLKYPIPTYRVKAAAG
jgi:hypothetical protein